jgi:hypothetical protein
MELKRRCEFLERKGIEVSCANVIWGWKNHADEYGTERLEKLDEKLGGRGLRYSRVEIYNSGREHQYFVCGTPKDLEEIKNHPVTKSMIGRYFDDEYEIKVEPFIYGDKSDLIQPDEIKDMAVVEGLLASCHEYLTAEQKQIEAMPAVKYKTDFAAGYDRVKLLDSLIDSPGRSLQYSEVLMYGYGIDAQRWYFFGVPTFDDVKQNCDYEFMTEKYGDRLTVSMTTYQYGGGAPLTTEEMKPLLMAALIELLSDSHDYMQKHDLSREICWKDFARNLEVNVNPTIPTESEQEDDYGCEP